MNNNSELFSTRRIEALSDGIFAIAMTLLVLSLNIPVLKETISNKELWDALYAMRTQFINFTISFLLLGSIWSVHMRQFEYIKQADRHLTLINNFRLFMVVLIPFTTSLAGAYPDQTAGRILLPINFFLLAVITAWQWHYATKDSSKFANNLSRIEIERGRARDQINIAIAFSVILLAYFIGTWAFLLFLAVPLILGVFVGNVRQSAK